MDFDNTQSINPLIGRIQIQMKKSDNQSVKFKIMMNEIKYRTGTLTKPTSEMSSTEFKIWEEQGKKEIREYLFSINQPLVYYRGEEIVAEYKDGRIEKLR